MVERADPDRKRRHRAMADEQTSPATPCEPCPRGGDRPEPTCTNRHQCWEPCGELGKSEEHVRVGQSTAGVTDTPRPEPVAWRWTEDGKHWFGWTTNWDHYERAKKLGYRVEHAYPDGVTTGAESQDECWACNGTGRVATSSNGEYIPDAPCAACNPNEKEPEAGS